MRTTSDLIPSAEPAHEPAYGSREKWFALVSFVFVTASAVMLFAR